jgi:hypothetical protein
MADDEPRTGELTTANYGWIKPTVGDSDDAWGGYLNSDLDGIDSVVHSIQTSIPTVPAASATAPAMDGTASAGSSAAWSRGDHVHPSDTTKYNTSNPSGYQTAAQVTAAVPVASSTTPVMDGTAAIGAGTTWARADHVHPSDTTKLPVAGVTNGSDAPPGQIGEIISSFRTTDQALTTATPTNVQSIALTPGDWDISGEVWFHLTSSPTISALIGSLNTVSATLPAVPAINTVYSQLNAPFTGTYVALALRTCRASVSVATTYYLVAQASFSTGTVANLGGLWARRAR